MFAIVFKLGNALDKTVLTLFIQICIGGILYSILSAMYFYIKKEETFISMFDFAKNK